MALIGASRLLLAYGIDYAARVQNGYVSPGTGGHARPPQELENGPVSSENVPASARASPTCRPLVMKGSPVRVRASALQAVLQGFLPPPATPERTLRVRNGYIFDRFRFQGMSGSKIGPLRWNPPITALVLWPMRVARVIAVLELGGAQLGALRLSLALRAHGIESRWLAGNATREGLALFRAHGVDVEVLGGGPALQYARRRAFAERLAVALLDEDLVHAHMFGAWWAAARAVPHHIPLAASEHNALQWPGRAPTRALREALARVDLFFAHGPAARREILAAGLPLERIREGNSPIAGSAVSPMRGLPSPRIVFAGRLHPEKGPDLLLDALARLAEPPPAFLLGAGVMEPELRRRAARLE